MDRYPEREVPVLKGGQGRRYDHASLLTVVLCVAMFAVVLACVAVQVVTIRRHAPPAVAR